MISNAAAVLFFWLPLIGGPIWCKRAELREFFHEVIWGDA